MADILVLESHYKIVKRFYHFKILRFLVLRFDIQKIQWKFQINQIPHPPDTGSATPVI